LIISVKFETSLGHQDKLAELHDIWMNGRQTDQCVQLNSVLNF